MVTADCAKTITCNGQNIWGEEDHNCDLNEVCVVENGVAICLEGMSNHIIKAIIVIVS